VGKIFPQKKKMKYTVYMAKRLSTRLKTSRSKKTKKRLEIKHAKLASKKKTK
jgi:hypothetical protein